MRSLEVQRKYAMSQYRDGEPLYKSARRARMSNDMFRKLLIDNDIEVRGRDKRYLCDETVFDDPLSDYARYWIGFLMADGSISRNNLVLGISSKDVDHLKEFKCFMKSDAPIPFYQSSYWATSDIARITINSKNIVDRLGSFGVVRNKSNTAKVKFLDQDRDFWRGVVDGDGCLSWRNGDNEYPRITLVGSEEICNQFLDFASCYVHTTANVRNTTSRAFQIAFGGIIAKTIVELLYKDCCYCLPRKRLLAQKIINWRKDDI